MMSDLPAGERKNAKKKLVMLVAAGVALLALAGASLVYLLTPNADADPLIPKKDWVSVVPNQVDFTAPQLSLTDLEGNPVALVDHLGEVVLVNNWAFWCPPCRAELPELQAYYEAHRQQPFSQFG